MPLWLLKDGQWPSLGTCQSSQPASWLWGHLPWKPCPGFAEAWRGVWGPETPFTEKPVACAPLEVKSEIRTRMWRLLIHTYRQSLRLPDGLPFFLFAKSSSNNGWESVHRNLVANILTTKIRCFSFRRRKDKQHPFWIWVFIICSTPVSLQKSCCLSFNLEPTKWPSQCCSLHPWIMVLREWRLSGWTSSILLKSVWSLVVSFVPTWSYFLAYFSPYDVMILIYIYFPTHRTREEILLHEIQKAQENSWIMGRYQMMVRPCVCWETCRELRQS